MLDNINEETLESEKLRVTVSVADGSVTDTKTSRITDEEFCGSSTEGSCSEDDDCVAGGCSGQVCASKNEEPIMTTCEYTECYDAEKYGVSCVCAEGKCRWSNENKGIVQGKILIGPICPVEREGVTCEPSPEAYSSRKIIIYATDGSTIIKETTPDEKGNYKISLIEGEYVVGIYRTGIDSSSDVPKNITVRKGETVELNISVDTGIR